MTTAIILNGKCLDFEVKDDYIICADGGYRLLGKKPDCVIGDFDSLAEIPKDVKVLKHSAVKNQTDGEICIEYAISQGFKDINIYGALDGRPDHVLGNLSLLNLAYRLGVNAVIRDKNTSVYYARGVFNLSVEEGDILSVIPYGGPAFVKSSKNLMYPLFNLELLPHRKRGISNIAAGKDISLEISRGGVLVFHIFK